jgi:hypothetical protein
MAGIRVDGGDDPILSDLAGDPEAPIGPIGALGGLHVLAGDQRQQRDRGLGPLVGRRVGDRFDQRACVVDQGRHQRVLGLGSSQSIWGLPGVV